ncbi:MAG: type II toxin-antitoxin system HicB family antitoxin [Lactobacillus sp.]|jgi:predicted RNase H-like HicB family nuclease|nr:type II toxin-antitoxin system HicB family antitoxin [Lactobacillus sp.]
MSRLVAYPAVLDDRENKKGEYTVTFPDVPGAISDGNNLPQALANGAIALGLILFDQKKLPEVTDMKQVQADNPDTIVSYIAVDLDKTEKESYKPMVKKNTRIPADLAHRAEKANINFSATLTKAIEKELDETAHH